MKTKFRSPKCYLDFIKQIISIVIWEKDSNYFSKSSGRVFAFYERSLTYHRICGEWLAETAACLCRFAKLFQLRVIPFEPKVLMQTRSNFFCRITHENTGTCEYSSLSPVHVGSYVHDSFKKSLLNLQSDSDLPV